MIYEEKEARSLVVQAGRRLLEAGLTARTWGNISARISETAFVITPSGLGYESMEPGDLVKVQISDCSYEGEQKPSSEKGVHADVYRLRPDAGFVVHTHQDKASVVSVAGEALTGMEHPILGSHVPCAAYGMPSTEKLRRAVAAELERAPEAKAVLMKNHGALCMGRDCESAFQAAEELERLCAGRVAETIGMMPGLEIPDYGKSKRVRNQFKFSLRGEENIYDLKHLPEDIPSEAAVHAAIYQNSDLIYLAGIQSPVVALVVRKGKELRPYLDDLAQIAGPSVRCARADWPETGILNRKQNLAVAKAIKGRNAVLFSDGGAICGGETADDVAAVRTLLNKGCEAALYGERKGCAPLGYGDAWLQRMIYTKKYSRQKEQS